MSNIIKKHIIKKANRNSDTDRITFFNNNIERYKFILEVIQRRSRWKFQKLIMSYWKPLK